MENRRLAETVEALTACVRKRPGDPEPLETLFEAVRLLEKGEPAEARRINRLVRNRSAAGVKASENYAGADRFYTLHRRALLQDARSDFDAYLQYLELDRDPSRRFYLPRRKVLLPLVKAMEALCNGSLELLAVSMPPGSGKTTLGIFFLSWVMGRFPDQPNLASGHSSFLTRSIHDGVLSVLTDGGRYLWADVFPEIRQIDACAKDTSIHLGESSRFKTLTSRSIEASLTGVTRCERILYADDLVDGIETALSRERLDKLWQLYTGNLRARKKEGCAELHVATRWSVYDPIGRLERQYGQSERARFVALPALGENGESNFDYDYGVGFSTSYFLDMKETLDTASFLALFQNRPMEREGQLYQEEELRRYSRLPEGEPDAVVGVCDTAEGGGDYTFLPVGCVYGQDCYIVDCVCDNGLPEVTDPLCARLLIRLGVQQCRFESNAAGGRTADKVRELVLEGGGRTDITKRFTTANKRTKILVHSGYVKERFLFRDEGLYDRASPYARMMRGLCSYSMTGTNRHDDVPDGMAQLAELLLSLTRGAMAVAVPRRSKMELPGMTRHIVNHL